MVFASDPAGNPSARIGCVGDQTGLLMMAGVQFVPAIACGSGSDCSVWLELDPCTSAMRNQPGWAMVTLTFTVMLSPL